MDRFFRISERGSSLRTEIIGGLVTFATMAYIVALNPAIPEAFCNRGAALQQLGRFNEAIESFQRELARAPNNDCALYRLTELARDTHREELALAALDRALAQNPQDSESYHRRGIIHRDLGEADLALKDYGEAIRLDPGEAGAMHDRAQVYRDRAQFPEALADVSHAISIAPPRAKELLSTCAALLSDRRLQAGDDGL